ncbi:MAG: NAD-dependent epimerase/dehydratase family protein [Pseudomonadota bacterium]
MKTDSFITEKSVILVTGCAGFIGAAICQALLSQNVMIIGIDNLNDYYDPNYKAARLKALKQAANFIFYQDDIVNNAALAKIFDLHNITHVIHLAAQAGVRYSLENPAAYIQSNVVGFANLIEICRQVKVKHFVYASSSSVYGDSQQFPYSTQANVDTPISLYAATKKSNELMAHAYAHLYQLPVCGLRFFTVYGPWGRPDMAPIKFAKKIWAGEEIEVFNQGLNERDFTYIDDIVNGTLKVFLQPSQNQVPYQLFNIGYGQPIKILYFIELLAHALGKSVQKKLLPRQPGDVVKTWAEIDALKKAVNYSPETSIEEGILRFAHWFKDNHALLI